VTAPAPLPHARVGALAGFLEIVVERGGRVDLHRLAGELHLDVRELLPLVDAAAALLGWVEVHEGDAIISGEGQAFVEAPVLARKELFRAALQQRTTLVTRIHAALSGKANRRLPESFFLGLLEQHFSRAEARRQLDTAIGWGRYAELFGFEDDTQRAVHRTTLVGRPTIQGKSRSRGRQRPTHGHVRHAESPGGRAERQALGLLEREREGEEDGAARSIED